MTSRSPIGSDRGTSNGSNTSEDSGRIILLPAGLSSFALGRHGMRPSIRIASLIYLQLHRFYLTTILCNRLSAKSMHALHLYALESNNG